MVGGGGAVLLDHLVKGSVFAAAVFEKSYVPRRFQPSSVWGKSYPGKGGTKAKGFPWERTCDWPRERRAAWPRPGWLESLLTGRLERRLDRSGRSSGVVVRNSNVIINVLGRRGRILNRLL